MGSKKLQHKYKSSRKNILKTERLIQNNHAVIKRIKESINL